MRTHQRGRLLSAALALLALVALGASRRAARDDSRRRAARRHRLRARRRTGRAPGQGHRRPGERRQDDQDRLEELHRVDHHRQHLRPGAEGRRLQRQVRPEPRAENVATKAIKQGQIDGYPEYTGTALTALLGVDPKDVPKDEDEAYEEAKKLYTSKLNLIALDADAVHRLELPGMTKEKAAELGNPKTISDLKGKSQDLTIAASAECFKRTDCALGLREGLRPEVQEEDPDRRRPAPRGDPLQEGRPDRSRSPPTGRSRPTKRSSSRTTRTSSRPTTSRSCSARRAARSSAPTGVKVIETVQKGLTTPVMSELNSRVDLDKQKPEDVASEYLKDYL